MNSCQGEGFYFTAQFAAKILIKVFTTNPVKPLPENPRSGFFLFFLLSHLSASSALISSSLTRS